jgi:poly-beta-1,6-N-acetyl-D-glucosamine N-deacetylase
MNASGRWSIQSHSRRGHGFVATGPNGETGAFFTNMSWQAGWKELESETEWRARVAKDLLGSNADIGRHQMPRPVLFAFPFSASTIPTNDPAIPRLLQRITDDLFTGVFEDSADARSITPSMQGSYLPRLEVFRTTSPTQLLKEMRLSVPSGGRDEGGT